MKTNYHNVGTVQKSNRKIVERGEIDTPYTHIHYYPIHMLGTCTSIHRRYIFLFNKTRVLFPH